MRKLILSIIIAATFGITALGQVSDPVPTTFSKAKALLKEAKVELVASKSEISNLNASLSVATQKIVEGESHTAEVQRLADEEHVALVQKTNEAVLWNQKYEKEVKVSAFERAHAHHLKTILAWTFGLLGGIGGGFAGFFLMRFVPTLSPAMAAYAMALPIIMGLAGAAGLPVLVWLLF